MVVNRVWHHLFGRGIVETVDNLGATGKAPTHPDLLDFASQLMDRDWSRTFDRLSSQYLMAIEQAKHGQREG